MKRFFLIFLLTSIFNSTNAYEGGVQKSFVPDQETATLEDTSFLTYYDSLYYNQKSYIENMKKCAEKNMYYMPSSTDVDADGCFDIISEIENVTTNVRDTEYVGTIDAAGDLKRYSSSDSRQRLGAGVTIADDYCRQQFGSGVRAMRYDDIKFLEKKNTLPQLSYSIFVFDAIRNFEGSNKVRLKTGELSEAGAANNWNCDNYTSRSSSMKSVRYKTMNSGSRMFSTSYNCSQKGYIVCVRD